MWAIARFILSFLSLVAISNALDSCTISGLTETHVVDGIRIARGSIGLGSMASDALFFEPISTTQPTPPILFSHSEVTIADTRTDLRPMAVRLAKHGASVLVLERAILWEPRDDVANREPSLVDCASKWLLVQPRMDVMHAVYVGPRLNGNNGSRRKPLAFTKLKPPAGGRLWVPLAESEGGYETVGFTKAETRDRLVALIEAQWSIEVAGK